MLKNLTFDKWMMLKKAASIINVNPYHLAAVEDAVTVEEDSET
jgi:hypothetical protein